MDAPALRAHGPAGSPAVDTVIPVDPALQGSDADTLFLEWFGVPRAAAFAVGGVWRWKNPRTAGVGLGLIVGGPANTGPASPIMTTISEQRVPTRMPERTANYVCSTIPGSGITSPRRAAASRARPSASTAAGTGRRSQISPTAASARST